MVTLEIFLSDCSNAFSKEGKVFNYLAEKEAACWFEVEELTKDQSLLNAKDLAESWNVVS